MVQKYATISLKPETKKRLVNTLNLRTWDEAINMLLDAYESKK